MAPQGLLRGEKPEATVTRLPGLLNNGAMNYVRMPMERFLVAEVAAAELTNDRLKNLLEDFEVDDRTVLNVPV